jgi:integrase
MGIYRGRAAGTWRVTAGSPQVERIVRGTQRDAELYEARLRLELDAAKLSTRASPSLRDFSTKVYAPHAVTHLAKSTWSTVRVYQVATLVRVLGEVKLTDIDVQTIQAFKAARTKEGTRPSSINNELRVLKTIMRHARATGYPCAEPTWKRLPETGERRAQAWSQAEMARLFDSCREHAPELLGVLLFLANTGCRKGEALAAEWSWVDLDAGLIRIPVTEHWSPKSGRSRDVPIPDVLRPLLEQTRAHERYLFPASHGGPYGRFPEGLWRRARDGAKLTGGPHQLRHTYASHFLQSVPDLQLLADVLGHSSTRVTELYRHLLPGHLGRARNAVQLGSLAAPLAKAGGPQQTGSEFASDTSSVGLCLPGFAGKSEQDAAGNNPENLQDSDALWRSSGGLTLELRGLAKASARLAEADALDRWLAAGGEL